VVGPQHADQAPPGRPGAALALGLGHSTARIPRRGAPGGAGGRRGAPGGAGAACPRRRWRPTVHAEEQLHLLQLRERKGATVVSTSASTGGSTSASTSAAVAGGGGAAPGAAPAVGPDYAYKLWQVILASSAGTVIEWYDFYLFGTLAALAGTLFFP